MSQSNNEDNNRNQDGLSKFFGTDSNVEFHDRAAVEALFSDIIPLDAGTGNEEEAAENMGDSDEIFDFGDVEIAEDMESVNEDFDAPASTFTRPSQQTSCNPLLAQQNRGHVAVVDCKVQVNEDGTHDIVWKADNIALNVTGVVVLDLFRGYVMTRLNRELEESGVVATEDMSQIATETLLGIQDELLHIYGQVKGSAENKYRVNLYDAEGGLPYVGARKPKDDGYEFINVGGALRDVGLITLVLMAKYIEETYTGKGMTAPDTFALFSSNGNHRNSVLAMDRNAYIRASKWQSVLSRLRRF
ncbi:hypothetical protein [Bacillus cereus]|uniref:hypothetical protein n=1 Tax=Bacillus cereus TaxID=1396 RepID=UPI001C8C2D38|nr:hypothetical protein [Bacillus cereus]MBX9158474.1 hypothetical protein [Bacillus cereus]